MLLESCGYVPAPLSGEDYVELLPERWHAINSYGIRIKHRTYDSPELNPLRRQHSGVAERKGLWEVHYDPYDISRIWVRDRRGERDRWITLFWRHLHRVGVPFGEMAWDHARQQNPNGSETQIAEAGSRPAQARPQRPYRRGAPSGQTVKEGSPGRSPHPSDRPEPENP
ncbi:hypothetical protein SMICM304S_09700 [Streptomyces microflavus]